MAGRPLTAAPSLTSIRDEQRAINRAADDLSAEIRNAAVNAGGVGNATLDDVNNAIADHVADPDPHTQYATDTSVANAIAAHVALPDPHTQYILKASLGTLFNAANDAAAAAGGVAVGALYRNGSIVMVRVA